MRQLAHELNSMLDGSMRYITIARQALAEIGGDPTADHAMKKLEAAQQGLRGMASLLEQTMAGAFGQNDHATPLGATVRQIVESCSAMAEQFDVCMDVHLSPAVEQLATGPLGPIVLNGLRNAIEACAGSQSGCRQVEISIGINCKNQLEMIIADTGPGVATSGSDKTNGHGIGLDLCRQLAAGAGGTVELMNVPFGGGAVLRVLLPVHHLQRA